jgi:pyruvate/2-oxoglutarate dehydrogenase complex dihydrolipoamide dehydrogenase (E3) component
LVYHERHATVCLLAEDAASNASVVDDNVYRTNLERYDRAITESDTSGVCKIQCKKRTDEIVDAMNVASRAGELNNEVTLAMKHGTGLGGIGCDIHEMWTLVH